MSDRKKTAGKLGWIKRVLKKDVPVVETQGGGEGVDQESMALAMDFGSLLQKKPYVTLPSDVRAELRRPVEEAIGKKDSEAAKKGIAAFDGRVAQAVSEVDKARAEETKIDGALAKLREQVEALEGTGLDATAAKAAIVTVTKAQEAARAKGVFDGRVGALETTAADAARAMKEAAALLTGKYNKGMADGLAEIRKGVAKAIDALPEGDPKKALAGKLSEWDKQKAEADKEADPDKKKQALSTLETAAGKLLDEALAASGGSREKQAAAAAEKQAIYKEALIKRFGLEISNPDNTKNTHFDQFYEMMAAVPVQQSQHNKLEALVYDKKSGGAAYGRARVGGKVVNMIEMGGSIDESAVGWQYHGKKVEVFKINTLHEIGHSVDDKYGVMSKSMGSAGCGGWTSVKVEAVASAFVKTFKAGVGKDVTLPESSLLTAVTAALQKGAVKDPFGNTSVPPPGDSDKPTGSRDEDWPKIKALLESCVQIRQDNWPWAKNKMVKMDSKAWHEAYDDDWFTYDPGARDKIEEVRDYQYRSPAEWFAELYAYTWYKKQEPKGGVDAAAAKYMWRADA